MRLQRWRERSGRALAGVLVLGASLPGACAMPVFRQALERWPASDYEIVVFHRGAPTDEAQQLIDQLRFAHAKNFANVEVKPVDVSGQMDSAMENLWTCQTNPAPPWVVVRAPNTSADASPVWAGPLTETLVEAVLDSPARRKITEGLLRGVSAVWVLLECGDPMRDEQAVDTLAGELRRLEKKLTLPPTSTDSSLRSPLPLRVAFGLVRVTRNDPAEEFFTTTLQHGRALFTGRPVAFPVFGRGRMLGGLVGREIVADEIEQACASIVAASSAEAKDQNPGRDLLLAANWNSIFDPAARQVGVAPSASVAPTAASPAPGPSTSPTSGSSRSGRTTALVVVGAILLAASVAAWRLKARAG